MIRFSVISFFAILVLVFSSCSKDHEDLLQGTWEWVNVENINDPHTYEWNFEAGDLTMYRRLKTDPSVVSVTDSGYYLLENNPLRTTLQLVDTSNEIWNEKWVVIKLDNEQLIINLDIEGGVLYREFVKKN